MQPARFRVSRKSASEQRAALLRGSAPPPARRPRRALLLVREELPVPPALAPFTPPLVAPPLTASSSSSSSPHHPHPPPLAARSSPSVSSPSSSSVFSATVADSQLQFTPFPQSLQQEEMESPKKKKKDEPPLRIEPDQYFVRYNVFNPFAQKRLAMQAIAIERALAGAKGPRFVPLWGKQVSVEGGQSFLLANYSVFWKRYQSMNPPDRVFYEMIQPAALVKCFTDYDASIDDMSAEQFERNVLLLNGVISERLLCLFGVRSKVISLRSSSARKHSMHCVWDMGNARFLSVLHLKAFMFQCGREAHLRFPSRTAEGSKKIFGILDMAVYKAGAYRLYGSTKLGEDRFLLDEDGNGREGMSKQVFLSSLVQHFAGSISRVLQCEIEGDATFSLLRRGKPNDEDRILRGEKGINALPISILRRIVSFADQPRLQEQKRFCLLLSTISSFLVFQLCVCVSPLVFGCYWFGPCSSLRTSFGRSSA